MTLLRVYRRFAQQVHFCDNCHQPIMPGQEYEGRVYAYRRDIPPTLRMSIDDSSRKVVGSRTRKYVIVFKEHTDPCTDPFEDEYPRGLEESEDLNSQTSSAA